MFYIAVGVACSIILIIALAVAAIHVHSMPNPSKEGLVLLYSNIFNKKNHFVLISNCRNLFCFCFFWGGWAGGRSKNWWGRGRGE